MDEPLTRLAAMIIEARRHTPGGVLTDTDMQGLYRSAARVTGMAADELRVKHKEQSNGR